MRGLPLFPPREERAGERRVVCSNRNPLSPTLSPFVPHGEREKTGFSSQQCLIHWQCSRSLPALLKQYCYIKRGERIRVRGLAPFYATLEYSGVKVPWLTFALVS